LWWKGEVCAASAQALISGSANMICSIGFVYEFGAVFSSPIRGLDCQFYSQSISQAVR
jgi:hypothetical protein